MSGFWKEQSSGGSGGGTDVSALQTQIANVNTKTNNHISNTNVHITDEEKTTLTNVTSHVNNNDIHVTSIEKTAYNNHLSATDIHVTSSDKENINKAHTHTNKTQLDKISEDSNGNLLYNGEKVKSDNALTKTQLEAINKIDDIETQVNTNKTNINTINQSITNKVDKVEGKTLTTNDLTNTLKTKYDDAVNKTHEHSNKSVLDKLTDDAGKLLYNGKEISSGTTGGTGADGEDGATFTPSVDTEGNLSWTNDKGLTNPDTVNIKGPKGDKGDKGDDASVDLTPYQQKTDNSLNTTAKTVVGAINEIKENVVAGVTDEQVATAVTNYLTNNPVSAEVTNDSVDLIKLNSNVFGNVYTIRGTGDWLYICFVLDTTNIETATEYNYSVSFELAYEEDTSTLVNSVGIADSAINNVATVDLNAGELKDKTAQYKLNLTGTSTVICPYLKLTGTDATSTGFNVIVSNLVVIINKVLVPILSCSAKSQSNIVGTCNIEGGEKSFIATRKELNSIYSSIDNINIDRYNFSTDLLSTDDDNCVKSTNTDDYFAIGFDFEEEVTDPTIELEYCIAEDNDFEISAMSYFPMLETATFMGATTYWTLTDTHKTAKLKKLKLTAQPSGTGRYWGLYIWGTSANLKHFCYIKAKYNGRYLKCIEGSTQPFCDNRIMNYGIYQKDKDKLTKWNNKIFIGFGDSTTVGENGATAGRGICYHIQKNFPNSIVLNRGSNGATSSAFYTSLSQITDFREVIGAFVCYGWNDGGATGNATTSFPQLICKGLEDVITTGITVDEAEITTEEQYWTLFSNDWYGNIAKGIEYIKFYNPLTQIYLHTPHSGDENAGHQAMCEAIAEGMTTMGKIFSVPVINTATELGINNRNSHLYRLDWAHLGDLGNDIKGQYIAKQMEDKLLVYPYEKYDDCEISTLTMNKTSETVEVEKAIYIYVKVAPYNASKTDIVWSVDNENVTVEEVVVGLQWHKAKVTGVTTGTSIVTATSTNGVTATCEINIT